MANDPFDSADPIEIAAPPERVNYATGVLLDATDFRDEQTYHRSRLARAFRYLVGFGTVAGLRVVRLPRMTANSCCASSRALRSTATAV